MIEKLLCAVFGHKYVVEMVFSPTLQEQRISCVIKKQLNINLCE